MNNRLLAKVFGLDTLIFSDKAITQTPKLIKALLECREARALISTEERSEKSGFY